MLRLLQGGMLWQDNGFTRQDVLLRDGVVEKISPDLYEPYAEVIDCSGSFLIPGIADMHVHVGERICGCELADDYRSISALADQTGIAAIGAFITELSTDDPYQKHLQRQYQFYQLKAKTECKIPIRWHLTPTVSEPEDILELLDEGCDLKFYTTYKPAGIYRSYAEIQRWMQDLSDIKPRMLIHCEDDEVISDYSNRNPFKHAFDLTLRRPELAEIKAVEQVLDLAVKNNYPAHIVHVSSPRAALLIKEAKGHAPVTCETAPHYLLLNEDSLKQENGHRWICTPPLRPEASRGMLVELLQDGVFDAIATDHCPFTTEDKDRYKDTPEQVPSGLAGLGATLPVLYDNLVKTGKIDINTLFQLLITNPLHIMSLSETNGQVKPGKAIKLFEMRIDAHKSKPVIASQSPSPNPWEDRKTRLRIRRII